MRTIVKAPRDPADHARYASRVAFAARQRRRFLEALGVTLEPARFRLRGRRFDAARALAVVTRGDPRMLVAREPRIRTDLYLGVIIDCSGSMQTRDNIEKARLFGIRLAEAAKGCRFICPVQCARKSAVAADFVRGARGFNPGWECCSGTRVALAMHAI